MREREPERERELLDEREREIQDERERERDPRPRKRTTVICIRSQLILQI